VAPAIVEARVELVELVDVNEQLINVRLIFFLCLLLL
jgi:hypothetical protein